MGHRQTFLRLTETFLSLQGEGIHAGLPCFFVRTSGCNLRCKWCDTEYAFTGGEKVSLDEILDRLPLNIPLVQITGGEPLLQEEEVCRLIEELHLRKKKVLLETGGHLSIERIPRETHIVLDIKLPGSGESHHDFAANLPFLKSADEIKFVIVDRADYEAAVAWLRDYQLANKCDLLFSPVYGRMNPAELARWVVEDRLPVRMQLQQHKYIWHPEARGV